eukprot:TRINITY_DN25079_c1_g1_i1.p1 TRINITY_DN25079_c1_g1~~TRINITY_DN25079_c1_g1_i1.p1  ORF type:complete len:461 (+),score=123.00 TRINITY_DN25079_c1_g1_i1:171-1385(+)
MGNAAAAGCKYAWILDNMKAERERGMTIDVSTWSFETSNNYHFTVTDVPGHRDFIRNMINGTSRADVAMLVVSAIIEEFEAGIGPSGQTREHARLAFILGVKQIIVCVNKMDHETVKYSESRFEELKEYLSQFLQQQVGYEFEKIVFVPISGLNGDNLVEKSDNMPWYEGTTLIQALDCIKPPQRLSDKPLRIPLQGIFKIGGVGTVPVGRVATGILKAGMFVNFAPAGLSDEVGSLQSRCDEAQAGDYVGFNVKNLSVTDLKRGDVCSEAKHDPAQGVSSFTAQIVVMNHAEGFGEGYAPILDCHSAHVACKVVRLLEKLHPRSGKKIESNPSLIKSGDVCLVTLEPTKPLCIEPYADYAPLGRFVLRDLRRTVAVGVVIFAKKGALAHDTPTRVARQASTRK